MQLRILVGVFVWLCAESARAQQKYATPVYVPVSLKKNPCDRAQTQAEGRLYVTVEPALENAVECSMSYDPDIKRIYSDRSKRYLVDSFTISCYKLGGGEQPAQLSLTEPENTCSRWHPRIKPKQIKLRFDGSDSYEKFHVLLYVKRSKYKDSTYCTMGQVPLPAVRELGSRVVAFAYRTNCVHPVGN